MVGGVSGKSRRRLPVIEDVKVHAPVAGSKISAVGVSPAPDPPPIISMRPVPERQLRGSFGRVPKIWSVEMTSPQHGESTMDTRYKRFGQRLALPVVAAALAVPMLGGTAYAAVTTSASAGAPSSLSTPGLSDDSQSGCTSDGECNTDATSDDKSDSDNSGWDNPTIKKGCRGWETSGAQNFHVKDQNWCRFIPGN